MDHVEIRTSQNVGLTVEIAGLGDRVVAALIDYLVIGAYVIAMSLLASVLIGLTNSLAVLLPLLLPALLYFLLCEVFLNGQSIGKRFVNIRVMRRDGTAPTLGDYLLRWLLRPIDIWLSSGLVAVVTVLLTGTGQRLGDLAADTTVVHAESNTDLRDTIFTRVDAEHTLTFPEVEALHPDDIATANEVLNTLIAERRSRTTARLGRRTKAALERKMGTTSDLGSV